MSKHNAHHGGAWKVAYADFITAMMALFLVLWLTAQDTKIKEAVERAFRNPFSAVTKESMGILPNKDRTATWKAQGPFESVTAVEMETMRRVSEALAKMLQQQDPTEQSVQIELTPEGLKINVFDKHHKPVFEAQSDVFTPYGKWVFSTLAWEVSRYKTFRIELEGHTEAINDPGATLRGKWELSAERANAARRTLVEHGVTPEQVCRVSGCADTMPMANLPAESESNRRVTVLLKIRETLAQVDSATETQQRQDRNELETPSQQHAAAAPVLSPNDLNNSSPDHHVN
jgi:chemotaxis protein MotB